MRRVAWYEDLEQWDFRPAQAVRSNALARSRPIPFHGAVRRLSGEPLQPASAPVCLCSEHISYEERQTRARRLDGKALPIRDPFAFDQAGEGWEKLLSRSPASVSSHSMTLIPLIQTG